MRPELSLVIATFNRCRPLCKLLKELEGQTLAKEKWEVVVAVDGSCDETVSMLNELSERESLPLVWFFQENAGQAGARHNAILKSNAEKIVVIDDDLRLCPGFLEGHLDALSDEDGRTVVIGKVMPVEKWKRRPLYEVVREYSNSVMHRKFEEGSIVPDGESFITQNVSFHKKFYLQVGGFDQEMRLGEDTFLGSQFQRNGGRFVFCRKAWAIHESNIGSYDKWIKRQYDYGRYMWLAWEHSNGDMYFHPLKYFCTGNRLNRLIVNSFVRSDILTNVAVLIFKWFGVFLQKAGLIFPAVATHRAIIALKQHQGLRDAYGSWSAFRRAELEYRLAIKGSQVFS